MLVTFRLPFLKTWQVFLLILFSKIHLATLGLVMARGLYIFVAAGGM